jgi:Tol biopolymer transport system component
MAFGFQNSSEHKVLFEKAKFTMETKGDLKGAINLFNEIIKKYPDQREYAAKSQLYIGICYEKLGLREAEKAFQKVVDNYPEQSEVVKMANEKLSVLMRAQAVVEKGDKEFNIRKVWAGPDVDTLGAPSPDGRYLSYVDWNTGDLAIRELATGKKRRLTDKGSWFKSPELALFSRWSPDSKKIVYNWLNKEDFFELHIIGPDDLTPRTLYRNEEVPYVQAWDWSPDGKHIFALFGRKNRLRAGLISVADGSLSVLSTIERLAPGVGGARGGFFSPNSSYVIYALPQSEDSLKCDILMLSIDGKHEIRLIEHPADDFPLCWSPDGKSLFFASDRTGTVDAWIIQVVDGKPQGNPKLIKKDIGHFLPMGTTRKGSFYYGINFRTDDVYIATFDPQTGKILSPPEKATRRFEGSNTSPDWSPDGKYLAYISSRGPRLMARNVLCIRSIETGEERELMPKLAGFGYPRWSPDGKFVSVEKGSDELDRGGIFRVDVQTGDVAPIGPLEPNKVIFSHRWSKDGKSIIYSRNVPDSKNTRILVHNLETGQEKELPGAPSNAKDIDISPDGRWLALINRERNRVLKVMPASGGESRVLHSWEQEGDYVHQPFIKSPAWTADGRYILFPKGRPDPDSKWELWRISVDGGEPEKTGIAMIQLRHFSVHPDGRRIAFCSRGVETKSPEVWVMENFLPEAKAKKK